jgi:hypothetical protein
MVVKKSVKLIKICFHYRHPGTPKPVTHTCTLEKNSHCCVISQKGQVNRTNQCLLAAFLQFYFVAARIKNKYKTPDNNGFFPPTAKGRQRGGFGPVKPYAPQYHFLHAYLHVLNNLLFGLTLSGLGFPNLFIQSMYDGLYWRTAH